MASYPDDMKMMQNYAEFDRNGAYSGNRGYNNMGGRNYYGSDGSYYANNGSGRGYNNNGSYRGDDYYDGMRGNNRRDREVSFSSSRGYNGSYSPNGRGYNGIERYGRGQRMSNAYNGYYNGDNGGGMRRMESYNGAGVGYSRSQYDFRRNGNRSGYAYADSYDRGQDGFRQGIRQDRAVPGFSYSSRVRENNYGRNYRGDNYRGEARGMRDNMGYYDERMGGMGYGAGYDDDLYGRDNDFDRYDLDRSRSGYGYGRSQY